MGILSSLRKVIVGVGDTPDTKARAVFNKLSQGVPMVVSHTGPLTEIYEAATRLSQRRVEKYGDYDTMEEDPILASALEMMTDDACQFSPDQGATVWAGPGSDKKFIKETFEKLDVENRVWGWAYNVAKYGDFFLGVVENEKGEFESLDESVHPKDVKRIDVEGRLAAFAMPVDMNFAIVPPWRFVHFLNNYRPTFEQVRVRIPKGEVPNPDDPTEERIITSRYGTSTLEAARRIYKVLNLLEQALALARLNRSPLIRVFYVNTEGMTPDERDEAVKVIEAHFKERSTMDLRNNLYRADFKALSFNTDIFLPYSGSKGDVRAETLGGEMNLKDIADIQYLKNKLFAAIRIPQAFLGFEEAMPGALGATALTRLDIRYARMVKKIQRAVISGIQRLLAIVYAYEKRSQPDTKKLVVQMETISGVEEMDRMSGLERRIGVGQQMIQVARDVESITDSIPIFKYIFTDILGLKDLGLTFKKKPEMPPEGATGGGFGAAYPEAPPEAGSYEQPEPEAMEDLPPGSQPLRDRLRDLVREDEYVRGEHADRNAGLPLKDAKLRLMELVKEPEKAPDESKDEKRAGS